MERITYKDECGYHLKVEHESDDTVTLLGQYEDSGLTPKEVMRFKELVEMYIGNPFGVYGGANDV